MKEMYLKEAYCKHCGQQLQYIVKQYEFGQVIVGTCNCNNSNEQLYKIQNEDTFPLAFEYTTEGLETEFKIRVDNKHSVEQLFYNALGTDNIDEIPFYKKYKEKYNENITRIMQRMRILNQEM